MTQLVYEKVVADYVYLRDHIAAADTAHKENMQPMRDALLRLAGAIQAQLVGDKLQNVRTEAGTAYLQKSVSVKVTDTAALAAFADAHGFGEFFKTVADPAAIKEYLEQGASRGCPPGVEPREVITAMVRRA